MTVPGGGEGDGGQGGWGLGIVRESRAGAHLIVRFTGSLARPGRVGGVGGVREFVDFSSGKNTDGKMPAMDEAAVLCCTAPLVGGWFTGRMSPSRGHGKNK